MINLQSIEKPSKRQYCKFVPPQYSPEELSKERWINIPGFTNYDISDLGRIRSYTSVSRKVRFINPTSDSCGYPQVKLYSAPNTHKSFKLHKLVALVFLPEVEGLPVVNHIDGDKQNPRLSNLERSTHVDNTRHAWKSGLCVSFKGEAHGQSKLKDADIPIIREMIGAGLPFREIGSRYGVSGTNIYFIAKGATWKHVK